jgi:hypothetical protein
MSHLSTLSQVQLRNLNALEAALEFIFERRKIRLTLQTQPTQIRGWGSALQREEFPLAILAQEMKADLGLRFHADNGSDAAPVLEGGVVQNGHFTLVGDHMMFPQHEFGPNFELITNPYEALAVTQALAPLGGSVQIDLNPDLSLNIFIQGAQTQTYA